jgi:tetratricopeptide (TPR) repeat protein
MPHQPLRSTCFPLLAALSLIAPASAADLSQSLSALQQVGGEGAGHAEAIAAWPTVAAASADQLPEILAAMQDHAPLADNWLRAAVDAIAERTLRSGGQLPREALEQYLADHQHSSRSRRLAFEWLTQTDPEAYARWVPKFLDDPSLELRREAVAQQLQRGLAAAESQRKDEAIAAYSQALRHARDIDQIELAYDALRKLNQPVDLPRHFGFVMQWYLIGPFDNHETVGFDRAYPPEEAIDLDAEYMGKSEVVRWQAAETQDDYGKVDLNMLLGKHMGAVAYGVAFFDAPMARPIELRLGCTNANKVWLNDQLLTANHVYHAGSSIDQYVGRGQLKTGRNTILVKICQNEQTDSWAQDWVFQLRVCDELGTAVLSSGGEDP